MECSICFESIIGDDFCKLPVCIHVFHKKCIDEWIQLGHSTCPLCRADVRGITLCTHKVLLPPIETEVASAPALVRRTQVMPLPLVPPAPSLQLRQPLLSGIPPQEIAIPSAPPLVQIRPRITEITPVASTSSRVAPAPVTAPVIVRRHRTTQEKDNEAFVDLICRTITFKNNPAGYTAYLLKVQQERDLKYFPEPPPRMIQQKEQTVIGKILCAIGFKKASVVPERLTNWA